MKRLTYAVIHILILFFAAYAYAGDLHNKWTGAEHNDLGNKGLDRACLKYESRLDFCQKKSIHREDGLSLTYGKILMLGDFYLKPDTSFYDDLAVGRLEKLFKCMDKQGRVHEKQYTHPDIKYPDCTWVQLINARDYLKVVSNNIDHFGWYNMKSYVEYHKEALQFAQEAFAYKEMGLYDEADAEFNRALFYNAFADHYLTDAFPAGHIRVPRLQIKRWAKRKIKLPFAESIGDALTAIFHNTDGTDFKGKEVGIRVKNSLGRSWITHSDGKLFSGNNYNSTAVAIPIKAVEESVQELFEVYLTGELPKGVYTATKHVPYPTESFMQKHKLPKGKRNQMKRLNHYYFSLNAALRIITPRTIIKKSIESLPEIFAELRNQVRSDIKKNSEIKRRLPSNYINGYLNIH